MKKAAMLHNPFQSTKNRREIQHPDPAVTMAKTAVQGPLAAAGRLCRTVTLSTVLSLPLRHSRDL